MTFKQIQWAAVFLGIVSIEGALLFKLITNGAERGSTEMIIAICIVAILFVLSSNVDSLKSVSLGKEGFKAELEVLERKTSENDQTITNLILLSMGPEAYKNLKMLAREEKYGVYVKEHGVGLETELYHLRNLGYIVLNKDKARSIRDIPESGDQLSDYISVTEAGKKYIELREKHALKG